MMTRYQFVYLVIACATSGVLSAAWSTDESGEKKPLGLFAAATFGALWPLCWFSLLVIFLLERYAGCDLSNAAFRRRFPSIFKGDAQ